jgi:hypothetical protein
MDKARKRFTQQPEEIKIIFVPQCNKCRFNRGLTVCDKFTAKPTKYMKNEQECPVKEGI